MKIVVAPDKFKGSLPATQVAEPEVQVDYDENGEPIPEAQEAQQQPKKTEDDPVVKKALELLGTKVG